MRFTYRRIFLALLAVLPFHAVPAARSAQASDVAQLIEALAVAHADESQSVVLDADGDPCPGDRLHVSWSEPGDEYQLGAYFSPVGPRPDGDVSDVNGIVLCRGSSYAFMGFEAVRDPSGAWAVTAVPVLPGHESAGDAGHGDHDGEHRDGEHADHGEDGEPPAEPEVAPPGVTVPTVDTAPAVAPAGIEGYAPYQPQRTCDPSPKPGLLAFRNMVLRKYPFTHSSGISRACGAGGRSEHKEGRAWDWAVNVNDAADRAAANSITGWMLATDEAGNRHAMARRTGLMYMIWNRRMWASYRPDAGWRAYSGPSAHTDHVHFSFSWAGARAETSFFSGMVIDVTSAVLAGTGTSGTSGTSGTRGTGSTAPSPAIHTHAGGDTVAAPAPAPEAPPPPKDDSHKAARRSTHEHAAAPPKREPRVESPGRRVSGGTREPRKAEPKVRSTGGKGRGTKAGRSPTKTVSAQGGAGGGKGAGGAKGGGAKGGKG